eukprot:Gb_38394 [translate_table: standard]
MFLVSTDHLRGPRRAIRMVLIFLNELISVCRCGFLPPKLMKYFLAVKISLCANCLECLCINMRIVLYSCHDLL